MPRRAWLLFNPYAGRINVLPFIHRARDVLVRGGWEVRMQPTGGRGHAIELARASAQEGCDALFVCGGDGTVGEAAAGLSGTDTALGVLPSGTANIWARELGFRGLGWTNFGALADAARRQLHAQVRRVDMGICNGRPFLLWAGVGMDAHVISKIEPRPVWLKPFGVPYYVAVAFFASLDWPGVAMEVQVDGRTAHMHALLALAGNIRNYGGGLFDLSPSARLDDGCLELTVFEGRTLADKLRRTGELWTGAHLRSPHVRQMRGRSFRIVSEPAAPIQFDGEPAGLTTPVEIETLPRALNVLVPPGHPLY